MSRTTFDAQVQEALHQVSYQLEQNEVDQFFTIKVAADKMGSRGRYQIDSTITQFDNFQQISVTKVDSNTEVRIDMTQSQRDSPNLAIVNDMIDEVLRWEHDQSGNPRVIQMIKHSLHNISGSMLPVRARLDPKKLDTLLAAVFSSRSLPDRYHFAVIEGEFVPRVAMRSSNFPEEGLQQGYRAPLFRNFSGAIPSWLVVDFPGQQFHLLKTVKGPAFAALLFTAIILLCFLITVRIILKQKKLSEMKSDFINNMTHEFKTPLATISLATEAMRNPRIRADESRMSYYMGIIKEENQRMNQQVERVLQLARSDIKLKRMPVEMHELLLRAAEKARLHIESKGGTLHLDLAASTDTIPGDEVHLSNLLHNLLENATKYSPSQPIIGLRSWEEGDTLCISVSDRGLGIAKADQGRIFDRFFRVSTGNLHDVKGFGLGLSYVKEIVEAHEGTIEVASKLGEGSTFTVRLPRKVDYAKV
ncbi:MAG: sensor histidine kinase, partial [Bacteroidia bacterium]